MNISIDNSTIVSFNGFTVDHLEFNGRIIKRPSTTPSSSAWFYILASESTDITWNVNSNKNYSMYYGLNSTSSWTSMAAGTTISLSKEDKLYIRGTYRPSGTSDNAYFTSTGNITIGGNIISIAAGTTSTSTISNRTSPYCNYQFYGLFKDCTKLISAEDMLLKIYDGNSYSHVCESMFEGCTGLLYPPSFSSTGFSSTSSTGYQYYFYKMFSGCSSLRYTPTISFSDARGTYFASNMFYNCTSLTDSYISFGGTTVGSYGYDAMFYGASKLCDLHINRLPATSVGSYGYRNMLRNTDLVTAPEISATTINNSSMYCMFTNCKSLRTAPSILPATTLAQQCYRTMFSGCENLENAPELPATTLTTSCYHYLFTNCSKINYIKCNAKTNIDETNCSHWVDNVASSGTFAKNSSATWTSGISGIPEGWTITNI